MSMESEILITNIDESIPNINNYITTMEIDGKKELTYNCILCKISATSQKVLLRHYEGKKHKMRVDREGKTFICELCQVTANSQKQLENHLKSARHKYQTEKKDIAECFKLNSNKGVWLILLGIVCTFVNLLFIFKICL